jgi:hypothetical protein
LIWSSGLLILERSTGSKNPKEGPARQKSQDIALKGKVNPGRPKGAIKPAVAPCIIAVKNAPSIA